MVWTSTEVTAAQMNANAPQEWSTYVATWTNVPNSGQVARYVQHGKTVHVRISTTVTGAVTGTISVSLPVPASAAYGFGGFAAMLESQATAVDTGATSRQGYAQLASATTINLFSTAAASVAWNATTPHTWANTDILVVAFTYEAA